MYIKILMNSTCHKWNSTTVVTRMKQLWIDSFTYLLYPWVTLVKVSRNMAFNSEDLLYKMEIWGHHWSRLCVMIICNELTKTWWYSDGDWVFKHTLRVSLLCGFNRKLAKKKSIRRSMSWPCAWAPLEKGLSA